MYGKVPDLRRLRALGCRAFAHRSKEIRKGKRIWCPKLRRIIKSNQVTFWECENHSERVRIESRARPDEPTVSGDEDDDSSTHSSPEESTSKNSVDIPDSSPKPQTSSTTTQRIPYSQPECPQQAPTAQKSSQSTRQSCRIRSERYRPYSKYKDEETVWSASTSPNAPSTSNALTSTNS